MFGDKLFPKPGLLDLGDFLMDEADYLNDELF